MFHFIKLSVFNFYSAFKITNRIIFIFKIECRANIKPAVWGERNMKYTGFTIVHSWQHKSVCKQIQLIVFTGKQSRFVRCLELS